VYFLRDQRTEFDTERDEEEEPVEQDNTVRISEASMFQPLYPEDDPKRYYCQNTRPESKVARPYIGIVQDLESELDSNICSYDNYESLKKSISTFTKKVNKPTE
jgi:hypothetical protein